MSKPIVVDYNRWGTQMFWYPSGETRPSFGTMTYVLQVKIANELDSGLSRQIGRLLIVEDQFEISGRDGLSRVSNGR